MINRNKLPMRRSPRMTTLDYSEPYVFSTTVCVFDRRPLFSKSESAGILESAVKQYASFCEMDLIAYCIMPDHLHVIIQPQGAAPVNRYIRSLKGRATYLLHKSGVVGRIWQRSFYDHIVRLAEDLPTAVRYVLENPVRSGLVNGFSEYPWSWDKFGVKVTGRI